MSTLLVGHVTKDGAIAGPRLLEHLVDVVLSFEGDRHARLRLVLGVKNRYGTTDEVGCFELHDEGITGLADPLRPLPDPPCRARPRHPPDRHPGGPPPAGGRGAGPHRRLPDPLPASYDAPAGDLPGLDDVGGPGAAGPDQRPRKRDIYSATVGGVKLSEPAADLAIALALASAASDTPLPKNLVAIGEVGLAGEVRRVTGVQRRLAEAHRLGFTHALVPSDPGVSAGMKSWSR